MENKSSIEGDIKQTKPFSSQKEKALVNLLYTHSWLTEQLQQYFKQYKINTTQYNILRILNGAAKPMTTSDIRGRMLNRMSDITRLIDRLLLNEYVIKKVRSADKRFVDISISPSGRQLLRDIS